MNKARLFILILSFLLFISCNASILMTNGEISKPGSSGSSSGGSPAGTVFSKKAPTGVNATKSYYGDRIGVRWNAVEGADYYTIEKTEHDDPAVPDNAIWSTIGETIPDTNYSDTLDLGVGKYYSYRVTAHTYSGETGAVSSSSTGTLLSSPETLNASKGTSETSILISWNQMPYVESYEIYKSTISSITGLKSEFVDTVNVNENSIEGYYSYVIDPSREKGVELYFAIVGLGPTGERASISNSRSGYTLVPGAPKKPEVSVSKGESTGPVEVRFRSAVDDSEYSYVIKRSYAGSAEQVVFSTEFDSLPAKDEDGWYLYTDTNVNDNVEYTYSITAANQEGISEAGIDSGYRLSPLKSLKLVPSSDPSHFGYDISYSLPVGADDENRNAEYIYNVKRILKDGSYTEKEYTEDEFSSFDAFVPMDKTPSHSSELQELLRIEITVSNGSETTKETVSNEIPMLPDPVSSISATRFSKPLAGDAANSSGVYPIHVTWTTESTKNQVLTREGSDGSVRTFSVTDGLFVDETTAPLVKYDYYIDTSDELGRTLGEIKHADNSYGAITPELYIDLFESISLKPWDRQAYVPEEYKSYWKKSRIATLVGYGNASDLGTQMKALADADDKDHYRGGKVTYSAAMEGVGGQIYFTYSDFGENPYFYVTGNYEMHVNASGTGSAASNTNGFAVFGMYPGRILLDKISVKSKNFAGTYVLSIDCTDGSESYEVAVK